MGCLSVVDQTAKTFGAAVRRTERSKVMLYYSCKTVSQSLLGG